MFTSQKPSTLSEYSDRQLQLLHESKSMVILMMLAAICDADENRIAQERKQEKAAAVGKQKENLVINAYVYPMHRSEFYKVLRHYDSMLILRPRVDAIAAGDAALFEIFKRGNQDVSLGDLYQTVADECESELQQLLAATLNEEGLDKIGLHAQTLAVSRAFLTLQDLLDKLPDSAIQALSDDIDWCFFKTLHFGDTDAFNYLLDKCVNPNLIQTGDHLGLYRPLSLLVNDLQGCTQNTRKLLDAAKGGDATYGSVEDIQAFYARRIDSYKQMIDSLLKHGADPDLKSDGDVKVVHSKTPRAVAEDALKNINEHYSDFASQMRDVLQCIAEAPMLEMQAPSMCM